MKVFISGPMTGYKDFNSKAFYDAEAELTSKGWSVFNPAWIKVDSTWDRNNLLPIDIAAVAQCDAIFMLTGWEQSAGARAEYEFAVSCGKTVIYQSTLNARSPKIIITDDIIAKRYGNRGVINNPLGAYVELFADHSPIDGNDVDMTEGDDETPDCSTQHDTDTCYVKRLDGAVVPGFIIDSTLINPRHDPVATTYTDTDIGKLPRLVRVKEDDSNATTQS
jgi:hypothetical protein